MYSSIPFAEIDVEKLTLLTNYTENQQKLLIEEAITGRLLFYIIYDCGRAIALVNGEIERIRLNHPKKVYLDFQNTVEYEENMQNKIQYIELYGWSSLWLEKECADKFLNISPKINRLTYTTPLMDSLFIAAEKFWLNHDPKLPPPKSSEIKKWLIAEFKLTERKAGAIDLIIRPEEHAKGGNKKIK